MNEKVNAMNRSIEIESKGIAKFSLDIPFTILRLLKSRLLRIEEKHNLKGRAIKFLTVLMSFKPFSIEIFRLEEIKSK